MMFAARQLQEKCQEQHRHLFRAFLDLTKAFDTICRESFWNIVATYGIPEKSFHEIILAKVPDERESSETCQIINDVKQGCVPAPTRFSVVFLCHGEMTTQTPWPSASALIAGCLIWEDCKPELK